MRCLAAGPGRRSDTTGEVIPSGVKVGDTVVYSKYGGTEITIDGEDLLILSGRDVLATIQELQEVVTGLLSASISQTRKKECRNY